MKTNACGNSLNCFDAFSKNQTGDFSLPVKGLRGFPLILCGLMDTYSYIEEKLYVASKHQRISNILFLLMNNSLRWLDGNQRISHCCFFPTISNFFAYCRALRHNCASYGVEVGHG